jgi:hypothetical protein
MGSADGRSTFSTSFNVVCAGILQVTIYLAGASGKRNLLQSATECFVALCSTIKPADAGQSKAESSCVDCTLGRYLRVRQGCR